MTEEKKKYEKWESVVNKIQEIPGMNKQDAILLDGRLAGRGKLNLAHHQMSRFAEGFAEEVHQSIAFS